MTGTILVVDDPPSTRYGHVGSGADTSEGDSAPGAVGTVNKNELPWPGVLSTQIRPP